MENLSPRQLFLRYLAPTSPEPMLLEVERAEGIYVYAPGGRPYMDLISGISVSSLGHQHPAVLQAVERQLRRHAHVMVYGEFVQSPTVELARELIATLPAHFGKVFFVNSGSEAIEGAMKLAKRATGRFEIIACHNAYHGSSQGALSIGGSETFKNAFRPLLPGIRQIRFGVEEDLALIGRQTAAVVVETVQGEAGVVTAGKPYFAELRRHCDESGALLVLDEIQCGFGRTGSFWAFEPYGIVPDILVSAKSLGGGLPLGAFIAPAPLMDCLSHDPVLGHISTFGGHPLSAAASLAALRTIRDEHLMDEVPRKAALFRELLRHPDVLEIRHSGFMMALQFSDAGRVQRLVHTALGQGLITDWFLFRPDALRIAPPLIISDAEIREAAERLLRAIGESR
jgi:putrescine aminotransferase